jgi:hypothetical protein
MNQRLVLRVSGGWKAALVGLWVLTSCSSAPPRGIVSGEVTFDGQPVEDGTILFEPEGGQGQTAGGPIKEGKYSAEVPVGKMRVRINGNKKTGRRYKVYDTPESPVVDEVVELLPPKYNINSELTVEVKPGAQQIPFHLKSR